MFSGSLVSCIMPTYNRRDFVPHAIRYFLRQDYENKELVIIDDGTDKIADLIPDHPNILYYQLPDKITLGAKLNLACKYAKGNIIVNWDDDDWYAPWRLTYQVEALTKMNKQVCGINRLMYLDLQSKNCFQYIYPANQRVWLIGSSLCYTKEIWNKYRFADINVGMDGLFVWSLKEEEVLPLDDHHFSVHMIHANNISPKDTAGSWWHAYPLETIKALMREDWQFYANGKITFPIVPGYKLLRLHNEKNRLKAKNVFACLVHEKTDCIIDLVRNLHYHDPESIILLYNGSGNKALLQQHSFLENNNIVIHPSPSPMRHGYLHQFALDCMQYTAEQLDVSFITIVDSDQLSIRPGYAAYMETYLSKKSNVGMLSSNPRRVNHFDKTNYVASQAFNEYNLWEPLLKQFVNGEQCFVYWTFWPSTVFTIQAIRSLLKIFKENNLLQHIMRHTKIWATEEVILPTLVKLLGYEIYENPCSYELVRYRQPACNKEIVKALEKPEIYWVHPVPRNHNDPVRKLVREKCKFYITNTSIVMKKNTLPKSFPVKKLFATIQKIEGWLSDSEATLFLTSCAQVFPVLEAPHQIVEIGSYHGKSTVVLGTLIQKLSPKGKLTSIDPHNGKVGAADQVLHKVAPSHESLVKNIKTANLEDAVEIIKEYSYNVKWDRPISLLFIDGLHDYYNVTRDFKQFAKWMVQGGLVAFHDYADYYPGIKKFVHELLDKGTYQQYALADTLIILKKL